MNILHEELEILSPIIEGLFLYKDNIKLSDETNNNFPCNICVNDIKTICDNLLRINKHLYNNKDYDTYCDQLFLSQWEKIFRYVTLNKSKVLKVQEYLKKLVPSLKEIKIEIPEKYINFDYNEIHKEFFSDNTVEYVLNKLSREQIKKWCETHRISSYYKTNWNKHEFTYNFIDYFNEHQVNPNTYTIQDKINVHNVLCCDLIKYYLSNPDTKKYYIDNEKKEYCWIFNVDNELQNYLKIEDKLEECVKKILEKDQQYCEKYNELYKKLAEIYWNEKYKYNDEYFENKEEINAKVLEEIIDICRKLGNFFESSEYNLFQQCSNFDTKYKITFRYIIELILKQGAKYSDEYNKLYEELKKMYPHEERNGEYIENKEELNIELIEKICKKREELSKSFFDWFFNHYNDKNLSILLSKNYERVYNDFEYAIQLTLKQDGENSEEFNKLYTELHEINIEIHNKKYEYCDKYKQKINYDLLKKIYDICNKLKYPKYGKYLMDSIKSLQDNLNKNMIKFKKKNEHLYEQFISTLQYNNDLNEIFKIYSENKDKLDYKVVHEMEKQYHDLELLYNKIGLLNEEDENGNLNAEMYWKNGIPTKRQQAYNILMYKRNIAESIIIKSTICYLFNDISKVQNNRDSLKEMSDEEFNEQYEYSKKLNEVINELVFNNENKNTENK